jgi:hypothetical protein
MQTKIFILIVGLTLVGLGAAILWRTPITAYQPRNADERALKNLFVTYIRARNDREVERFLSTPHTDCRYMVDRDQMVDKGTLRGMLPGLWMQNDEGNAAFGKCMAWECWNENYYATGMLINPRFEIKGERAFVRLQFHSGLFLDENFIDLVREDGRWQIVRFERPKH